jgi:YhcH/YjgK/YiaL family protein
MIIDSISNLRKYTGIPRLDRILDFLSKNDLSGLNEGDIPIDGDDLFVKVLRYVPKRAEENNFETHDVYTDVQIVVEGIEIMQTVPKDCLRPLDHSIPGDFRFFDADKDVSSFVVRKNDFAVFFPGEAHKPSCLYKNHEISVKKLVFKVKRGN